LNAELREKEVSEGDGLVRKKVSKQGKITIVLLSKTKTNHLTRRPHITVVQKDSHTSKNCDPATNHRLKHLL